MACDCSVALATQVGTHHVFVEAVQDLDLDRQGSPLLYANRAYGRLVASLH